MPRIKWYSWSHFGTMLIRSRPTAELGIPSVCTRQPWTSCWWSEDVYRCETNFYECEYDDTQTLYTHVCDDMLCLPTSFSETVMWRNPAEVGLASYKPLFVDPLAWAIEPPLEDPLSTEPPYDWIIFGILGFGGYLFYVPVKIGDRRMYVSIARRYRQMLIKNFGDRDVRVYKPPFEMAIRTNGEDLGGMVLLRPGNVVHLYPPNEDPYYISAVYGIFVDSPIGVRQRFRRELAIPDLSYIGYHSGLGSLIPNAYLGIPSAQARSEADSVLIPFNLIYVAGTSTFSDITLPGWGPKIGLNVSGIDESAFKPVLEDLSGGSFVYVRYKFVPAKVIIEYAVDENDEPVTLFAGSKMIYLCNPRLDCNISERTEEEDGTIRVYRTYRYNLDYGNRPIAEAWCSYIHDFRVWETYVTYAIKPMTTIDLGVIAFGHKFLTGFDLRERSSKIGRFMNRVIFIKPDGTYEVSDAFKPGHMGYAICLIYDSFAICMTPVAWGGTDHTTSTIDKAQLSFLPNAPPVPFIVVTDDGKMYRDRIYFATFAIWVDDVVYRDGGDLDVDYYVGRLKRFTPRPGVRSSFLLPPYTRHVVYPWHTARYAEVDTFVEGRDLVVTGKTHPNVRIRAILSYPSSNSCIAMEGTISDENGNFSITMRDVVPDSGAELRLVLLIGMPDEQ